MDIFNVAKNITKTYAGGMAQGAKASLPAMERAAHLIREGRINVTKEVTQFVEAEAILLDEIRRIKNLPF